MKNIKRAVSVILVLTMIVSIFVSTGMFVSASSDLEQQILAQAHAEPTTVEETDETLTEIVANSETVVPEPVAATAQETGDSELATSGTCGDNLTWTLDTTTGVLNITGTGDMYDYHYDGPIAPWFKYDSYISSVVIGDSVTSISMFAFDNCKSIKSVHIGDSVTSIGYSAFSGCSSLINVNIPDSVQSIGGSAFGACTSLESITISNSVTSIGYSAFSFCTSLTSVTIPNSVTSIGDSAFYSCTSLTSMTIPDSVTTIGEGAFHSCTSLVSITVPDSITYIGKDAFYDTAYYNNSSNWIDNVLYFGNHLVSVDTSLSGTCVIKDGTKYISDGAFKKCTDITSVTIPDSVTSIGSFAFEGCKSLTSITIPDSVTSMGNYAFIGCSSLKSVSISNSITHINTGVFDGCVSLESITIPDSVESIGMHVFFDCWSLASVTIGNSVTSIDTGAFFRCTSLTSITIPNSVTSIGSSAFSSCDSLTSVTIGDSVTSIGFAAFEDCQSLTSIIIPDSVTSIGTHAFHDYINGRYYPLNITIKCYENSYAHTYAIENGFEYVLLETVSGTCGDSLTWSIDENGLLTISGSGAMNNYSYGTSPWYAYRNTINSIVISEDVTAIGEYAFQGCKLITEITVPKNITIIGNHAFFECISLENITVDPSNEYYSSSEGVLYNKDKTTLIKYPTGNKRTEFTIPNSVTAISDSALRGNSALKSITIGYCVVTIGDSAFRECKAITEINIPDSVLVIGYSAFYSCTALVNVTVGESVTTIGNNAFSYCTALENITLGESVTTIRGNVFSGCGKLTIKCYEDSYTKSFAIENDIPYKLIDVISGTCGDHLTWNLDLDTGTLTISGSGEMYDYSYGYVNGSYVHTAPWGNYIQSIEKLVVGDSVTSIGASAFYNCDLITSIVIPDSVISIGDSSFVSCDSLENVDFGNSIITIGAYAFSYCASLKDIIIPDSLTTIGSQFEGSYIENLIIPDSVISISSCAFMEGGITNITIPKSVKEIGIAAFHDTYVKNVYIEDMEAWCNINFVSVESNPLHWRGNLYLNGELVTDLVIPDSVTSINDYSFNSCVSLTSVIIPDSVTTIGCSAFENCDSLTSVTISASVTKIDDYAFSYCDALISVTVDENNQYFSNDDCGALFDKYKTTLIQYPNGNTATSYVIPDSVTSLGNVAFYNCTKLKSVTIPNSVTRIGYSTFSCDDYYSNHKLKLTIKCYENSYAHTYAVNNGIAYEFMYTHSFTNYISDNNYTCTEDGTKTAYCDNGCGASETIVDMGSAAHRYTVDVVREPSCSKTGLGMYICSECGDYYTASIPAVDHIYTEYIYNGDATCMADGTKTAYCDYGCGYTDTVTAAGTITDHKYTDYIYNNDATCTADGTMTAYCDYNCGAFDTLSVEGSMLEHSYAADIIEEPTCVSTGMILYMCSCRAYYFEEIPMIDHTWSEWNITIAPTTTSAGLQTRACSVCSAEETQEIPMLVKPEIAVDNYTVTISQAEYITAMRYASGEHTTASAIKNAADRVDLSETVIANNTVDGNFVYEMSDGGYYTFWVRMTDGTEYFLVADMTKFIPAVDTYGVKITVDGLYDAKDFFIAKGEFNSYTEIKTNGYIVRLTPNKIAGKHSYTYTVSEPGMHTVLVRYNDGREYFFHEELVVDEPVFTTNGLQVTISNIPDVKVIRTAYGEYYTPGDTKRAEGARNFSNKSVIKDAEEYTIQYREEGRVTIIVEYNNGYVKVFHYDVVQKTPTMEQNGNTVTFGNLDGLVMVRYAKGEYSTSSEIKKAPGSKVLKPDAIVNGKITVAGLVTGTYTFCVQFDDDSYNYYTITIK